MVLNMTIQSEPEHHKRYRVAWEAHRDPDTPKSCLKDIENEMDNAQNDFKWDEFQEFKQTLPGYIEHWEKMKNDLDKKLLDIIDKEIKDK